MIATHLMVQQKVLEHCPWKAGPLTSQEDTAHTIVLLVPMQTTAGLTTSTWALLHVAPMVRRVPESSSLASSSQAGGQQEVVLLEPRAEA